MENNYWVDDGRKNHMALVPRKEFTRTALMYALKDYEYIFGEEAALAALECLTKLLKDDMAKNQEQERSREALENARPSSGAIH